MRPATTMLHELSAEVKSLEERCQKAEKQRDHARESLAALQLATGRCLTNSSLPDSTKRAIKEAFEVGDLVISDNGAVGYLGYPGDKRTIVDNDALNLLRGHLPQDQNNSEAGAVEIRWHVHAVDPQRGYLVLYTGVTNRKGQLIFAQCGVIVNPLPEWKNRAMPYEWDGDPAVVMLYSDYLETYGGAHSHE